MQRPAAWCPRGVGRTTTNRLTCQYYATNRHMQTNSYAPRSGAARPVSHARGVSCFKRPTYSPCQPGMVGTGSSGSLSAGAEAAGA